MTDVLQLAAGILIALILGADGCMAGASAAVAGTWPGQVHAHGYDAPVYVEPSAYTAPERPRGAQLRHQAGHEAFHVIWGSNWWA